MRRWYKTYIKIYREGTYGGKWDQRSIFLTKDLIKDLIRIKTYTHEGKSVLGVTFPADNGKHTGRNFEMKIRIYRTELRPFGNLRY